MIIRKRIPIAVVVMGTLLLLPGDGRTQEEAFFADTGSRMSTMTTTVATGETQQMDDVEMPPAHVVIVVDDLNLEPRHRKRVFDQPQKSLEANLRPQDLTMVAMFPASRRESLFRGQDRRLRPAAGPLAPGRALWRRARSGRSRAPRQKSPRPAPAHPDRS